MIRMILACTAAAGVGYGSTHNIVPLTFFSAVAWAAVAYWGGYRAAIQAALGAKT